MWKLNVLNHTIKDPDKLSLRMGSEVKDAVTFIIITTYRLYIPHLITPGTVA